MDTFTSENHEYFDMGGRAYSVYSQGVLLCFALDDLKSFEYLQENYKIWMDIFAFNNKSAIFLVGTKKDLNIKTVDDKMIQSLQQKLVEEYPELVTDIPYYEVSGLQGTNVDVFYGISRKVLQLNDDSKDLDTQLRKDIVKSKKCIIL